jgi:hypothetical protein
MICRIGTSTISSSFVDLPVVVGSSGFFAVSTAFAVTAIKTCSWSVVFMTGKMVVASYVVVVSFLDTLSTTGDSVSVVFGSMSNVGGSIFCSCYFSCSYSMHFWTFVVSVVPYSIISCLFDFLGITGII